ncbi:PAS domain-containing protein [Pantanalinema rosaneae CENA516]|uniref:PAS domain-containing protein n=1 Tax=Pantanalinema rosaneae TaxID=1620701 RepID=UPI003D6ECA6D
MLHSDSSIYVSSAAVASPWQVIEVLDHLQQQSSSSTPSCIYIYDLVDQCNICSSQSIASLLGYAPNHPLMQEELGFAQLIHPDDLERVAAHFQKFTTLTPGEVIKVEYRMLRSDGIWRHLHSQETVFVQASNGLPLQVLGIIQDITDSRSLDQPQTCIAHVIAHLSDYVTVIDRTRMMADLRCLLQVG